MSDPFGHGAFDGLMRDYLFEFYRKRTEGASGYLVYHLGNRGFYAEISTVARAMLYCFAKGRRLLLRADDFGYRYEKGWEDYFRPIGPPCDTLPTEGDILHCFSDRRGGGELFDEVRAFMPEAFTIGPVTIRGAQEILRLFMLMAFRLAPEVEGRVRRLIADLELPLRYNAVHIRRGDKVGDEDIFYPAEAYVERLEEGDATLPVFVLSDDFEAVREFETTLEARIGGAAVITLCNESHQGFDIYALRDRTLVYQKGEGDGRQGTDGQAYRENIFEETVRLLAETLVAARAQRFVGTRISNIGWMVKTLHSDLERCALLDPGRRVFNEAPVKPPHKYYLDHRKEFFGEAGHERLLERLAPLIEALPEDGPTPLAVDVGACVGRFLPRLEGLLPEARGVILGFEPNPLNWEALNRVELAHRSVFFPSALSDRAGTAALSTLVDHPDNREGYTLASLRGDGAAIAEVGVERFDQALDRLGYNRVEIRFVKIDAEGNDTNVIRGMESRLADTRYIVFESSDCLDDRRGPGEATPLRNIVEFLDEHGFDSYKLGEHRLLKMNGADWHPTYENTKFHSNNFALKKGDPVIRRLCDENGFWRGPEEASEVPSEAVLEPELAAAPKPLTQGRLNPPCIVSERYRFICVPISKNASSTLKRVLATERYGAQLRNRADIPAEQWRDYFVFSVARDPESRLLSAYQELSMRMEGGEMAHRPFTAMAEGEARIERFLEGVEAEKWDGHIRDQVEYLRGIEVDFVATVERLEEGINQVAAWLGMPPVESLPTLRSREGRRDIYGYGKHLHQPEELSEATRQRIRALYAEDGELHRKATREGLGRRFPHEWVQPMEIVTLRGDTFHLFLDIFLHWSGEKICATTAYYGDDIDWAEHGVDLEKIVLSADGVEVTGNYIPHRLDSWEPAILFDFESPELTRLLREREMLNFTITAGPHRKRFFLRCQPAAAHPVAMSVIIQDENQWIGAYLDYYLLCMDVAHIFVYDNYTKDRERLLEILEPYARAGQVTYIPWHYHWRNRIDNKQIGQPPQQSHTLNRYGTTPWIGLFDVDEFLRIPGRTLPQFLADHDTRETDGLSFDIRWFLYHGDLSLKEIDNPLFSFFQCKPDILGRKRQKLMVAARQVRFARFHWLEDGKRERAINDPEIFFHHYYVQRDRFERGKVEHDTTFDDYMLRFQPRIEAFHAKSDARPDALAAEERVALKSRAQWIKHIDNAFALAEAERSKLDAHVLAVDGYCGTRNRHLLNNLCDFDGCEYLEVGSFLGASLCAAAFGNALSATAIDNWSQFGGTRERFEANIARCLGGARLGVLEADCFAVDVRGLPRCNVYYYDGEHSRESQYRAITHFHPRFQRYTVLLVDDWNWKDVRDGTRQAIADLGLKVVHEREIILPKEEVEGMPRHRGARTWWNGLYVALIEREETEVVEESSPSPVAQPFPAPPAPVVLGGEQEAVQEVAGPLPIEVVIFSRDRACQLDALLRSMERFVQVAHHKTVLYAASNDDFERGYRSLMAGNRATRFVRESDFKRDLLSILTEARRLGRHILFLVDDILFLRDWSGGDNLQLFTDNENILTLSLRLGEKITHCQPRGMATTPHDFTDSNLWHWREGSDGYWNYPMSLDGHLFRAEDIVDRLSQLAFSNPNILEAALAGQDIQKPLMLAERRPYLVNLALNRVQSTFANPSGEVSADRLNRAYLDGRRIDIEPIIGGEYDACHIVPTVTLR